MSRVTIVVPSPMRQFVGGEARIPVEAATVREALGAFASRSDNLRGHLFDHDEELRRFIRVFVNGKLATMQDLQEESIAEGAEVTILLALAGG